MVPPFAFLTSRSNLPSTVLTTSSVSTEPQRFSRSSIGLVRPSPTSLTHAGITRAAVIETDGETLVVVKRTVTPEQRLRMALADNRATELSTWDADRLQQLQAQAPDLLQHLWTEQELAQLLTRETPHVGLTDPDAVPDERPTTIQRGDLFALGPHRVLCGDSTQAADVARVLDGTRPLLMATDPPYGVEYEPVWRARAGVNLNPNKLGTVTNDDRAHLRRCPPAPWFRDARPCLWPRVVSRSAD